MEQMSNFSIYGGFENEVIGLTNYEDQYYIAPPVTSDSGCNLPEVVNTLYFYSQTNIQVSYPVVPVIHGGTTYYYYSQVVYLPVYYFVPVYFTCQDPIGFEEACAIQDTSNAGVGCDYACDDKPEEYGIGVDYISYKSVCVPVEGVSQEMTLCYNCEEFPEKLCDAPVNSDTEDFSSDSGLENDAASNIPAVNEIEDSQFIEKEPPSSVDADVCEEFIDENIIKKISSLSIDEVKEDIDDNYENGKAFLYNQVLKGYLENKSQLEELEWECHTLDDIPEEEEPETDSSEMDLDENVLEDLENDSKMNYLVGVLDEPVPTSTLICEKVQEVLSEESVALDYKMKFETSQILESSSYSLEDPAPDTPGVSTNNEEFDCVSEMSDGPTLSMTSRDKIEDEVPDTPEISLSKELDCVPEENIEVPPPSLAPRDRAEDEVPDTLEISPTKELGTVSLDITEHPPPSLVSRDRIEDRVPDTPAVSPNKPLDSLDSQEIIESLHPSTGSGGRIEENEEILVPEMLEPLSAATSQSNNKKKRFSSLRKFLSRICCCKKTPPS